VPDGSGGIPVLHPLCQVYVSRFPQTQGVTIDSFFKVYIARGRTVELLVIWEATVRLNIPGTLLPGKASRSAFYSSEETNA